MNRTDKTISQLDRNRKSITRRKTVLVVDDDAAMVLLTNNILKKDGYAVLAATSGKDALETLSRTLVDAAVLDILMPNMSGLELYRKMQDDEILKLIPVIFVTADNGKNTVLQAVGMGAANYIVKPYDELALLEKIRAAIEEAKIDPGVHYLTMKTKAILTELRHNKPLTSLLKDSPKGEGLSAVDHLNYERNLRKNWDRADILIKEIPQEVFSPAFELMLKRFRICISARDTDGASKVGQHILEELKRYV
ncbi:MAG: response regulator [Spirochaetaceae bacterium]|jgi:CheY-like chemotaxis protein|nr:response regulator [Spirochaetaceae bacterium]